MLPSPLKKFESCSSETSVGMIFMPTQMRMMISDIIMVLTRKDFDLTFCRYVKPKTCFQPLVFIYATHFLYEYFVERRLAKLKAHGRNSRVQQFPDKRLRLCLVLYVEGGAV